MSLIDEVNRITRLLRLHDWTISTYNTADEKDAHVVIDREKRTAVIRYNPMAPNLEFLVRHEMVHIFLADMDFVACNGRSVDIMEIYNLYEERVANVLAAALDVHYDF